MPTANDDFNYTLKDPQVNYELTPFITYQIPGANCFSYTLEDGSGNLATLPALTTATLNFPTLVLE